MPSKTKTAAASPSEQAIRDRAYFLWEAAGRPEGTGDHFWHLAQAEATQAAKVGTPAPAAGTGRGSAGQAAPAKAGKLKAAEAGKPKARGKSKPGDSKSAKRTVPKPRAAILPPK